MRSPGKRKGGRDSSEKVGTPMSCAETPSGGSSKDKQSPEDVTAEVEAVALALAREDEEDTAAIELDESKEEEEAEDAADGDWAAEERKLRQENLQRQEETRKKNKSMGIKEKVELLNNLLQKAAAYTAFLRERMKTSAPEAPAAALSKKPKARNGQFEHQERDPRQPKLVEGVMRTYQIEGLMWICSLYENGLNGILADEMGLGKTVQAVSFLAHLYGMKVKGPFMVVAPLSTLTNWQREFARWAPSVKVSCHRPKHVYAICTCVLIHVCVDNVYAYACTHPGAAVPRVKGRAAGDAAKIWLRKTAEAQGDGLVPGAADII